MKKVIFIILLLMSIGISSAETPDLVRIMELAYNNGDIDIIDTIVKYGYYPDRLQQPETGYKLEITSIGDDLLYEFLFEPSTKEYIDYADEEGNLHGGLLFVDETHFALVVPSFNNEKDIKIYNQDGELVTSLQVKEIPPILSPKQGIFGGLILIALIVISIIAWKKKHKENPHVRKQYPGWQ